MRVPFISELITRKDKSGESEATYSMTITVREVLDRVQERAFDQVVKDIADKWVEQYGAEMLNLLSPEKVHEAIEKQLASKFWGKD